MGLFLQTAIIKNCNASTAKTIIEKVAEEKNGLDLNAKECQYKEINGGINILFNEYCNGYEDLANAISQEINQPILLLYIYDDDYWGYFLYENGREIDRFNPMPDYFVAASNAEKERCSGNSAVIAKYFNVNDADIKNYLVTWAEGMDEDCERKAYEDDEFNQYDCWQMADFMKKIGYPYEW